MDQELWMQTLPLSKGIRASLEQIKSVTSMRELVADFQGLVVKLLQFSSKLHHTKKASKDECQKESLSFLLKVIKSCIPQLSHACQQSLKENEYQTIQNRDKVIKKLDYCIKEALKIVRGVKDDMNICNSSKEQLTVDLNDYTAGSHLIDEFDFDKNSEISLSTSFYGSFASFEPNNNDLISQVQLDQKGVKLDFQLLESICMDIIEEIKKPFEDQEMLFSPEKYPKQNFGKKLMKDLEKFTVLARKLEFKTSLEVSAHEKKIKDVSELGLDFISMVIDFSRSKMLEDDFKILLNVSKHIEAHLNDILKNVKEFHGKGAKSNELQAAAIIDGITNCVNERNFIGLADAICLFIERCKASKKAIEESNKDLQPELKEQFLKYDRRFHHDLQEVESISNELIENIKDRKTLHLLVTKMQNIIDMLSDYHLMFEAAGDKINCVSNSVVKQETQFEAAKEKKCSNDYESNFSLFVGQFPKAINENDYRTVEILANRFLGNIKQVGELLQRISRHSTRDVMDLRLHFAKYLKAAGRFCSQSRKAVLNEATSSIHDLIQAGKEMEILKDEFINKCQKSLKPWFDISYAFQVGKQRDLPQNKLDVLNLTKQLKMIIELLSDSEFMEKQNMKKELVKISNIITKSADYPSGGKLAQKGDVTPNDAFLSEMFALQWTVAVMNILEIVDRFSFHYLQFDPAMNIEHLKTATATWISMLGKLSLCCTDDEGLNEISNRIDEFTSISKKLEAAAEEKLESFEAKIELAITKRHFFANVLLSMELADILTQGVKELMEGYIDPLTSLSFAPGLHSYITIRNAFENKMETIHTMSCLAVQDSPFRSKSHLVFVTIDELKLISQELISTISSSNALSPHSDGFKNKLSLLKLRWRLEATYLVKVLLTTPETNYTAVAGVLRHLQTTSHVGRYEELIAILKDVGCKKSFSKDSWKYRRELSFEDLFADDIGADHNSSISSILNYPNSRDADLFLTSSPHIDSPEASYFRNYSDSFKEDSVPPRPLIQTPDTLNPQSSFSSAKTFSSQDTEIFIPKQMRRSGTSKDSKSRDRERLSAVKGDIFTGTEVSEDLPARHQNGGSVIVKGESRVANSIAAAAQILLRELEEWEEDGNSIITVVKKMTTQMLEMADYSNGKGQLRSKEEFINTAKAIAANAQIVAKFAIIIADCCLDETCQLNLLHYAEIIPAISTQLNIIASVKAATPNDETANVMLITNAENLMRSVSGTLRAAESASVKMRSDLDSEDGQPRSKSAALAIKWKKKLDLRRSLESLTAPTNELGLKIIKDNSILSITDL